MLDNENGNVITSHDLSPLDESLQMIAAAPPKIGRPISMGGNLRQGQKHVPTSGQPASVAIGLILTVLPYTAVAAIFFQLPGHLLFPSAAMIGAIAIWGTSRLSRVAPATSHLGTLGLSVAKHIDEYIQTRTLRFSDASRLFCNETIHYVNGQPSGFGFCFRWTDKLGHEIFEISGSKYSNDQVTGTEHLHDLVYAAEDLWTQHLMQSLDSSIQSRAPIQFLVKGNGTVILEDGALTFHIPGTKAKWMSQEIASVWIQGGCIFFKKQGVSNLTNRGQASFSLGLLSDRQCFCSLLETYTGLKIDDAPEVE